MENAWLQGKLSIGSSQVRNAFLLIVFTLLGTLTGCDKLDTQNQQDYDAVLTRAESYLDQGQIRAALIEARNALQSQPDNIQAHLLMAKIANKAGQYRSAIEQLENIQDPAALKNLDYVLTLGEAYVSRNKFHSAKSLLEDTKSLGANSAEHQLLLAKTYRGLIENKRAEQAIEATLKLAANDPEIQSQAYTELANLQAKQENIEAAKETLDKAIAAKPLPIALMAKAALAYREGDLEMTEDLLSNALIESPKTDVITPERAKILRSLVQVLSKSGRSSEALIYSKLLAEASPNSEELEAKMTEAVELYKAGKLDEAEALLTEIYTENPNEFSGRLLGLINAMQGDFVEADTYLSENVDPEVVSGEVVKMLAGTKLKLNQADEALEILQNRVAQTPDDPAILSLYGMALLNTGKTAEGLANLEKAYELNPGDTRLAVTLANVYQKQGAKPKAQQLLEKTYNDNKTNEQIAVALSRYYLANGQTDKAKSLSREILKNASDKPYAHAIAATIANSEQDYATSIKHFEKAVSIAPESGALKLGLSNAYLKANQPAKAINLLEKLIETEGNNTAVYKAYITAHEINKTIDTGLAKMAALSKEHIQLWAPYAVLSEYYFRRKNLTEAIKFADLSLERNATHKYPIRVALRAYNQKGAVALANENYSVARESLLYALQLKPNNSNYLALLATVEIRSQSYGEAEKIIAQIEGMFPDSPLAAELKGDLAASKQEFKQALKLYQSAWNKRPSNPIGRKIVKTKENLNDDPTTFLEAWVSTTPNNPTALLIQGVTLQKLGNRSEAIEAYKNLLEVEPNSLPALNNLAWIKNELGQRDALEYAKKGAELYPENAAMLDTYGWTLLSQGYNQEAKMVLKKAHQLAPNNKEIESHYLKAQQQK